MWRQSPLLQHRLTRILPHAIDTVLLASALALLWLFQFQPWEHPWLLAKIAVLLVYIGTGTIALKRGKTRQQRLIAFIAAIVSFGFITSVAVTKSPLGYLALL